MCQQIRFVEILFSLRWYVELILQGQTLSLYFKLFHGVFGGGTRLAMPKTILRAGLIVIESLVQGLLRESWIRGSPDSRTISFGRTVGLRRHKIEDFVPCSDGTLLGVEGNLGNTDMYISSFVTELV